MGGVGLVPPFPGSRPFAQCLNIHVFVLGVLTPFRLPFAPSGCCRARYCYLAHEARHPVDARHPVATVPRRPVDARHPVATVLDIAV